MTWKYAAQRRPDHAESSSGDERAAVTSAMLENPPQRVAQMLGAFRPVFQREVFLLGGVRGTIPRWPLADFFDGLDTVN